MLTRTNSKNGDELSILGFGCMRFPMKGVNIDEPRSIALIRTAIDQGMNYFDTAYFYHGGKSESLLGEALSGGYREKVKIATKLPPFMVTKLDGADDRKDRGHHGRYQLADQKLGVVSVVVLEYLVQTVEAMCQVADDYAHENQRLNHEDGPDESP